MKTWPLAVLSALGAGLVYGVGLHVPRLPEIPTVCPARDRREAEARLAAWEDAATAPTLPVCRSRIWGDERTQSVVVLLHGYTNCPHQFHQLARLLVADGHTVLAPRLPHHGQANRQPRDLGDMTPGVLAAFLGEALAVAHGLGEQITVLGFSFGGVLAGWAAQQRGDVDHAILASASLGVAAVRPWLRRPMTNVTTVLPDRVRWWDAERRDEKLGPPHGYVVYSMRGVGTMLGLGNGLLAVARRRRPATARITVAVNPCDTVVDNRTALALVAAWRARGAVVTEYSFPPTMNLIHDYMDPLQPEQQVDRVYPIMREWIASCAAE